MTEKGSLYFHCKIHKEFLCNNSGKQVRFFKYIVWTELNRGRILREGLTDVVHMKVSETTARIHRIFYIQIQM